MNRDHHLVIVGGGVAGLDIASRIGGRDALRVTLIDREPAHIWKPMLHTIAAGTQSSSFQQTSFVGQAHERGFAYQPGEAIGIDRKQREVRLGPIVADGRDIVPARSVSYDTLVLAVGSEANDFGTPGAGRHCVTINSRGQAIAFNDRMRIELLHAVAQDRTFGVAIVGGGATGVELAAEIVQLAEIVQGYGISGLRERIRVTLIDTGDRLLRAFPERISHAVAARLREMGVEVNLNVKVVSVDEEAFHLSDGKIVRAEMKVWVAGVRPPHLLSTIEGIQLSKLGQIVVGDDLRSVDDRSIVGVGDCASPRFADASILVPTTAQAASQEADYLVRHLPTLIAGGTAPAFQYRDFGSLVSLGGYDAYGTLGRVGLFRGGFLKGRVAQLGHALLYRRHQARLHGLGRGSLLWLADVLNARVRPRARLT